jgi:CheY-like chemotaxis protein
MPGMDGYAVCRQIRQQHGSNIAVIALSGWGQDRDKQLAREAGFDLHLTKPADPGALAGSILALCARPTPRHPLR